MEPFPSPQTAALGAFLTKDAAGKGMRTELFLTQYGNVNTLSALCKQAGIFYKLQATFQDLFFFFDVDHFLSLY